MDEGKLTLQMNNEQVDFNVHKSMKYSNKDDDPFYFIYTFIEIVQSYFEEISTHEVVDSRLGIKEEDSVERVFALSTKEGTEKEEEGEATGVEELIRDFESRMKPSVEVPPTLELTTRDHIFGLRTEGERETSGNSSKAQTGDSMEDFRYPGDMPDLLHSQDSDEGELQTFNSATTKAESKYEGSSEEGSSQTTGRESNIPHFRQCLGDPRPGSPKEGRNDSYNQ